MDEIINKLKNLLVELEEKDIEILSHKSLKLNYAIHKIYQDDNYWKRRVKRLLGAEFDYSEFDQLRLKHSWYDIYKKNYDGKIYSFVEVSYPQYELTFPTGNEDIDILILLNTGLKEIVSLYKISRKARLFLDKPKIFQIIKDKYHIYAGYINSVEDLVKLDQELIKAKPRCKLYHNQQIEDFRPNDRIISGGTNFVVNTVEQVGKNYFITVYKSDLYGNRIDTNIFEGKLAKNAHQSWRWLINMALQISVFQYESVKFGILLFKHGPQIKTLESPFLKYKTLPVEKRIKAEPEVNMMVGVIKMKEFLYYIESRTGAGNDTILTLRYIGNKQGIPDKLIASKPKTWKTVKGEIIVKKVWMTDQFGKVEIEVGSWTGI